LFEATGLSSLGQCDRQAAERKNLLWDIGELEQHLLDFLGQCLKG